MSRSLIELCYDVACGTLDEGMVLQWDMVFLHNMSYVVEKLSEYVLWKHISAETRVFWMFCTIRSSIWFLIILLIRIARTWYRPLDAIWIMKIMIKQFWADGAKCRDFDVQFVRSSERRQGEGNVCSDDWQILFTGGCEMLWSDTAGVCHCNKLLQFCISHSWEVS